MNSMLASAYQFRLASATFEHTTIPYKGGVFKLSGSLMGLLSTATSKNILYLVVVDSRGIPIKVDPKELLDLLLQSYLESSVEFYEEYSSLSSAA